MTKKEEAGTSLDRDSAEYKRLYDELWDDPAIRDLTPEARKYVVEQNIKLILLERKKK